MGTHAQDRQKKLENLFLGVAQRLPEDRFVLAGSLYPGEWKWPGNVQHFDHIGAAQHPALYSSSKFTLNLTRGEMARGGYCPSGRFFEAAACGTPIISDWFEGLDSFFEPGREIAIAIDTEQVLEALRMPDQERAAMARRARERTAREHTGERRAEQLIEYMREAMEYKSSVRAQAVRMEASL